MNKISALSILLTMSLFLCCNKNTIIVYFENVNPNDFEILLSAGFPIRFNNNPDTIYKDGVYYDIPNEYGENGLLTTKDRNNVRSDILKRIGDILINTSSLFLKSRIPFIVR